MRTLAGIDQSGYASSTAVTGCPALTRAMYDSFTSTSISSEPMSTMVAMPVRVKPPPADTGDTISPRCASFETTMPPKGARTVQLSRSCCATLTRASAAATCSRARTSRARRLSTAMRA